jgi:hypothetical protein
MQNNIDVRYRTIRYAELGLILFVWLVLLMTPVLFGENNDRPLLNSVLNQLEILIPLSILFLINRFLLVPKFLFKRKPWQFFLSALGIIIILAISTYIYNEKFKKYPPEQNEEREAVMRPQPPPPPEQGDRPEHPGPPQDRKSGPVPPYANFLILSVLVVGFDTGLLSALRWMKVENEKVMLEKEHVATQLSLLRSQVSPHFFMNTLNNIHALVDANTGEAKEAIIKLSKMMRYLLYETETEKTTLKKEMEFLESYINLMKLRFSEKVTITLNLPSIVPDMKIAPFLFISFIENAFKHGISYRKESFISIDLIPFENHLEFVVKNSKNESINSKEFSGIGIDNARKRLDLLFGVNYKLDIRESKDLYEVDLTVPI